MSDHDPWMSAGIPPAGVGQGDFDQEGDKSFVVTWLLSLFLGFLGADRFYLGKSGTAVAKLVTCGGCGLWALIDLIVILAGGMRDRGGYRLRGVHNRSTRTVAWIVSAVVVLGGGGGPQWHVNQTYQAPVQPVVTVTATP